MNLYDAEMLKKSLSFSYRMMVASAPLLEFAMERSGGPLRVYFERHLEEERGHELMVARDLRVLGVREIEHSHQAAQIAGSQYYLIAHEHPAMLLGYMHALESESLQLSEVERLGAHHGVELTALKHHCEHDPQHAADLESEIARLCPDLRERVLWNAQCVKRFIESAIGY